MQAVIKHSSVMMSATENNKKDFPLPEVKMNKIEMAREVMLMLEFIHADKYGEEFNKLRKQGMSVADIYEMLTGDCC